MPNTPTDTSVLGELPTQSLALGVGAEMTEEWRAIPGWPGYEVSSNGQVRSLDRDVPYRNETRRRRGKLMCQSMNLGASGKPYAVVGLSNRGQKSFPVHRLVLMAFVGPRPEGMQGCHNDGNTLNNHVSNLRWDTPKNNSADREKHGTLAHGNRAPQRKLSEADALAIAASTETTGVLALRYGVNRRTIQTIRSGDGWFRITGITERIVVRCEIHNAVSCPTCGKTPDQIAAWKAKRIQTLAQKQHE